MPAHTLTSSDCKVSAAHSTTVIVTRCDGTPCASTSSSIRSRTGAGARFDEIELSALVQIVQVTDDAESAIDQLCSRAPGLTPDDVVEVPYALIGTADAIAEKLERCRSRWGISYFVVRDRQQFEPVIAQLR